MTEGGIYIKEDFIQETEIVEKTEKEHKEDLLKEIEDSKNRLHAFYENMNIADNSLADYYIYQIKAEEAKYSYLLNQIRKE